MAEREYAAVDAWTSVSPVERFTFGGEDELVIAAPPGVYKNVQPEFVESDEELPELSRNLIGTAEWPYDPAYCVSMPEGKLVQGTAPVSRSGVLYHDLATHAGRHVLPPFVRQDGEGGKTASIPDLPEISHRGHAALLFFSEASGYNHSHWLLQTVNKVGFFERAGITPDRFLALPTIRPYQRETLNALGIPESRLQVLEPGFTHRFDRLSVAYTGNDVHPDMTVYQRLIDKVAVPDNAPKRIYVSRQDARNMRRFLNEDRLIETAQKLGFTILTPSALSFEEEITLFHRAELIAGPVGAGLYNSIFTRPGAFLLALSDPAYVMNWPMQLAALAGHRIGYLLGNSFLSWEPIHRGTHNNWVLDPARFAEMVERIDRD